MPERYCPKCHADVEDVGGFCLLGHSLKVRSVTEEGLPDIRAEVDEAFEVARSKIRAVVSGGFEDEVAAQPPAPPPPPLPDDLEDQTKTNMEKLWVGFEDELNAPLDPITSFAPSPRMDWGPEKEKPKRKGLARFRTDP